jgi:hypothetical protein
MHQGPVNSSACIAEVGPVMVVIAQCRPAGYDVDAAVMS